MSTIIYASALLIQSVCIAVVASNTPFYSFDPPKLDGILEHSEHQVQISCSNSSSASPSRSLSLRAISSDPDVASVHGNRTVSCHCNESLPPIASNMSSEFVVRSHFLGRTVIKVVTLSVTRLDVRNSHRMLASNHSLPPDVEYHVSVIRKERFIDHLFLGLVSMMVIIANVGMGCKIDLAVVREVLTKPIAPAIGFSCQYIIMPLVCMHLHFTHSTGKNRGVDTWYSTSCWKTHDRITAFAFSAEAGPRYNFNFFYIVYVLYIVLCISCFFVFHQLMKHTVFVCRGIM